MEKATNTEAVIKLMLQSYRRYKEGDITESQAIRENSILGNILKAVEVGETERRLKAIEEALNQREYE